MPEKSEGDLIQLPRHAALVHEEAHKDKKRHDRQAIVLRGVDEEPPDHRDRGAEIRLQRVTRHADDPHREGDGHAQENEREDRAKSDQSFGHLSAFSAGRPQIRITTPRTTSATAVRAVQIATSQAV